MIKVTKTDDFDEKLIQHNRLMKENEGYRKATESLTFTVGTKLSLCIEVTDEFYSQNLINMLHDKLDGGELLGFKVTELNFNPEATKKGAVINVLNQVIQNIDKFKL
ncbi:hypothetical protein [Bacillus mycoides]|uniref:Uncharacterized protein n=1 Tax=Bacillus mycoides TaxID=1405 RepID=A0A4U3A570_BACMY|nr:hypothetical protein [Bacillus mycoides]TKI82655.1 hypothetical protein FC701_20655 [Bacillus mycoides]